MSRVSSVQPAESGFEDSTRPRECQRPRVRLLMSHNSVTLYSSKEPPDLQLTLFFSLML